MRLHRAALVAPTLLAALATGIGAQERRRPAPVPALEVQGADNPLSQTAFGTIRFALDRVGYAAVFEFGRDGRLRVLYPHAPGDTAPIASQRTVHARAWSTEFTGRYASLAVSTGSRVPYVFVLTSDRRFDLSRFGSGKSWRRQLLPPVPGDLPEVLIPEVARLVLGDTPNFDYDFGYLAPRLTAGQQIALLRCASFAAFRSDDFWAYADLWGAISPSLFGVGRWGYLGLATRLSPGCGERYAPFPQIYAATIPNVGTGRPAVPGPVTPRPPTDSAATPDTGRAVAQAPPSRPAGQNRKAIHVDNSVLRRGAQPEGKAQALDAIEASRGETPAERTRRWGAERLARQPASVDQAYHRAMRETVRVMRREGVSFDEASRIVERRMALRENGATPIHAYGIGSESGGPSRVVERSANAHAPGGGTAVESVRPAPGSAPSAPSASSGNAPTQVRGGDAPRKAQ